MKIRKSQLEQIIKEEIENFRSNQGYFSSLKESEALPGILANESSIESSLSNVDKALQALSMAIHSLNSNQKCGEPVRNLRIAYTGAMKAVHDIRYCLAQQQTANNKGL